MKKAIFYISIIASLGLLINILDIIINDMERLTRFGWGYLTGRIILLAIFVFLIFFMFSKTYGKSEE
ncbi:hypothetical protein [Flavobacterium album]|uniref:hypothetical protein n=1 Tax=Flavobacterium album TaxID=2175091 RepID=UPI0011B1E872|nr:hypothetical protein [Flavobacterium album]